jgi:hypothetical protein
MLIPCSWLDAVVHCNIGLGPHKLTLVDVCYCLVCTQFVLKLC